MPRNDQPAGETQRRNNPASDTASAKNPNKAGVNAAPNPGDKRGQEIDNPANRSRHAAGANQGQSVNEGHSSASRGASAGRNAPRNEQNNRDND